LLFLYFY